MLGRRPQAFQAWAAVAALLLLCVVLWRHTSSQVRLPEASACQRGDSWWQDLQHKLRQDVAEAEGWEVVLFGDSITEALRNTSRGLPCERCAGAPEVLQTHIGSKHRAAVLGIAGDHTRHLLWRLQHGGELPATHPPKLVVLLIGTNDLGAVSDGGEAAILRAVDGLAQRTEVIARHLQQHLPPSTRIALLDLLPRGTPSPANWFADNSVCGSADAPGASPGKAASKGKYGRPAFELPSLFSRALEQANDNLRALASRMPRVEFVDCGGRLLVAGGRIVEELMPDALHPSARGYDRLLSQCWAPAIERLLSNH